MTPPKRRRLRDDRYSSLTDPDAERNVIGVLMNTTRDAEAIFQVITAEDFYDHGWGAIFHVIVGLWANGDTPDVATVWDRYKLDGGSKITTEALIDAQATVPSLSAGLKYAQVVARFSAARRIVALAADTAEAVYDGTDPAEVLDSARERVATEGARQMAPADDLHTFDEFLEVVEQRRRALVTEFGSDWVIPDLIRPRWRVLLVAPEGIGKSLVLRQIAIYGSQGLDPFTSAPVPSHPKVLYVELENPDEVIAHQTSAMLRRVRELAGAAYDPSRMVLWHREAGINLRSAVGRSELEARIAYVRPNLVCLGPVYKSFRLGSDNYEVAAADVQAVLDNLRVRYNFGLIMEHHAAKGTTTGARAMDPAGSGLWLRWPEIGPVLDPEDPTDEERRMRRYRRLRLARYRGDRVPNGWPVALMRSDPSDMGMPWIGDWADQPRTAPPGMRDFSGPEHGF